MIDISFIVPVYNAMPYLEKCVASLAEQDYPPDRIEIIFVDDGSTDASGAFLDQAAKTHANMRVIHTPNSGGPGRPRNIGLDNARGEYVFFCDADDWLDSRAARQMLLHAHDWESDVLIVKCVGENGRPVASEVYAHTEPKVDVYGVACHALGPTRLVRRSLIESNKLQFMESWSLWEDQPFVLSAMLMAQTVSIAVDLDYYHVVGREDGGGASTRASRDNSSYEAVWNYITTMVGIVEKHGDVELARTNLLPRIFTEGIYDAGRILGSMGDREMAQELFGKLKKQLAPYLGDDTTLTLSAYRGMVIKAFTEGDFAAWQELCLDDSNKQLRYDSPYLIYDDTARTVHLRWSSSEGHVFELNAAGRNISFDKGLISVAWENERLLLSGRVVGRDLYEMTSLEIFVQPRKRRYLGVSFPVTLIAMDKTHEPVKAINDSSLNGGLIWYAEVPWNDLRGKNDSFDWDFFIRTTYANGYERCPRLSCVSLPAEELTTFSPRVVGCDAIACYATDKGNLSLALQVRKLCLSVSGWGRGATIKIDATSSRYPKDQELVLVFKRGDKRRTVRCQMGEAARTDFGLLDLKGSLRWQVFAQLDMDGVRLEMEPKVRRGK